MANVRKDRLAPPLMYAFRMAHEKRDAKAKLDLRDEAGERVIAPRRMTTRSPISESGLRREVMTDLLSLLNTTNLDAARGFVLGARGAQFDSQLSAFPISVGAPSTKIP